LHTPAIQHLGDRDRRTASSRSGWAMRPCLKNKNNNRKQNKKTKEEGKERLEVSVTCSRR
jgi:hypothetical protein